MNQKKFYEKKAEKDFSKAIYPYYGHWRTKKVILDLIKGSQGKLLDLGCGDGVFLKELGRGVGLDISKTRLKRAKKHSNKLVEGDAQQLPFKNKSFDTILCTALIEHLPNQEECLKEMRRTLKDDGKVVLSIPIAGLYRLILARLGIKLYLNPEEHLREWSKYEAKGFTNLKKFYQDVEEAGFSVEKTLGSSVPELPLQDWVLKNKTLRKFFSRIEDTYNHTQLKYLGRKLVFLLKKS